MSRILPITDEEEAEIQREIARIPTTLERHGPGARPVPPLRRGLPRPRRKHPPQPRPAAQAECKLSVTTQADS